MNLYFMVKKRTTTFDVVFGILNAFLLLCFCLIILYPVYYMFIVSISSSNAVMRGEVSWFPIDISLDAYSVILSDRYIPRSYLNTIIYTTLGTFVNITMTALCAYPLSRKNFQGKNVFTFMIVFTMMFDAGLVPNFLIVDSLGLRNTIFAILLPGAINAYNMVIMRTFFQQLPEALFESARIDGAGDFTIFFRILLPLSKPVLASITLFYAVGHWNSFMGPLLYLDDRNLYPMQLILRNIVISNEMASMSGGMSEMLVSPTNIKYAVIFITILPILMIYPFVQKYFNKGIMIGALKG